MTRRLLRSLYSMVRSLDDKNLPGLSWVPSKLKRQWVRRVFRGLDRLGSGRGPVELDGLRYHVPESMRSTLVLQEHEPGVRKVLAEELRPGMRVVDVGANVGYHALYAARLVGPEGKVWAVEPAEENLEYLRANLQENRGNGLARVEVLPVAAGAVRERRRFQLRPDAGHHGFYDHPIETTVREIEVDVVPLDEVIPAPVDLVKIDVEAGEAEALAGMERLLEQSPRVRVLVEWNPPLLEAAGRDPSEVPRWLTAHGFRLEVIEADGSRRRFDAATLDPGKEHEVWAERPTGRTPEP